MKKETFDTIMKMIEMDALTERQKQQVCDFKPTFMTTREVAEMLGISPQTVRKLPIPYVLLNHRHVKYKLSDVFRYVDENTEI